IEAPAFSTVAISSASRVKSAERIDGAISIMANAQGVGVRTAVGRRFTLVFVPARFAGVVLLFVCTGVFELALPFSARLVLRFAVRLVLSFAFLFAGFRLLALALALFAADELSCSVGELCAFALAFALL